MTQLPSHIRNVAHQALCIYNQTQVEDALDVMALSIEKRLEHENPVLLSVMIGAITTCAHLLTRMSFPLQIDYVHATRYRGTTQGGEIDWLHKPGIPLVDRTVLIVDDILDHGYTLTAIIEYCRQAGAKQVLTAVLLDKKCNRPADVVQNADFTALSVPNRYVFGYGMDYEGYLRNLPGIFALPDA